MRLFEITTNVLYHVTTTANAEKIRHKGILPLQTSNWVKGSPDGERYGAGEIFAFEHKSDAVRWAGKMDWDFNQAFGTGKISIVEFLADDDSWNIDTADPLGQVGAAGKWFKRRKHVAAGLIQNIYPVTIEMIKSNRL